MKSVRSNIAAWPVVNMLGQISERYGLAHFLCVCTIMKPVKNEVLNKARDITMQYRRHCTFDVTIYRSIDHVPTIEDALYDDIT